MSTHQACCTRLLEAALFAHAETTLVTLAQRFSKRSVDVAFCKVPLDIITSDYHEEVTLRAWALIKSMTVGREQGNGLQMLPWERHCMPSWSPPRSKGEFSVKFLEPASKARTLAEEIFEQKGICTLKELQVELTAKLPALLAMDSTWHLEMAMLEYLIKSGAELRMWQDMMSWMPSERKSLSPGDVLSKFVEYEASSTFSLLPLSMRATVAAAKAFVASVHRGIPPNQIKESTGNMKKFADRTMGSGRWEGSLSPKPCLRKLRVFFSLNKSEIQAFLDAGFCVRVRQASICRMAYFISESVPGENGAASKEITGLPALKFRWEKVMVDDGKKVTSYSELALFQVWDYLLTPPQRKVLDAVTKRLLGSQTSSSGGGTASQPGRKAKKKDSSLDDMATARQYFR